MTDFRQELQDVINRHSQENGSNTPDYILADYLSNCLLAFDTAVNIRETWHGRTPGWRAAVPPTPMNWTPPPDNAEPGQVKAHSR